MEKKIKRFRRAYKTKIKIKLLQKIRLCVTKTSNHIYAQIIDSGSAKVLACASTIEKNIKDKFAHCGNKKAASYIGEIIAERSIKYGIKNVAFDRSGFKYHGRIKVLAESARKFGLNF